MDRAVQKTDDDATASKYSSVLQKYYEDEYIQYFCTHKPPRRLPLINIGTYCRIYGMDKLLTDFFERTNDVAERAIVSLGAGSDTRAFHLLPKYKNLSYYELDFPVKTKQKEQIIATNEPLASIISAAADRYHLIGADLRDLAKNPDIDDPASPLHSLAQLRSKHTLVLSECCLCYLQPAASDGVLQFFADLIPETQVSVAIYEPISLNDGFGRVMCENLAMRGLSLPTINLYPTLDSQKTRLAKLMRVNTTGAADIKTVYSQWVDAANRERIARLEFLDEVEEMNLLLSHYCIAWGH